MNEERGLYQIAAFHYPLEFERSEPTKDGILLEGKAGEYFLLKKFPGKKPELLASLEAENFLRRKGIAWALPCVPLIGGEASLEEGGACYYLKRWEPDEPEMPFRWQYHFGCESLARVHLASEGFQPVHQEGWEWPDWLRLFEMARDVVYEMHSTVVNEKDENLAKYFDRTAREAIRAMEESVVHLRACGYHEQREAAMRRGYINLTRALAPTPGMSFDLVGKVTPDIPACGLGAFIGQMGNWTETRVLNDVVDLLDIYNRTRRLTGDEIDLIKGFLKFPWQFWWATEEYFAKENAKKRQKIYAKALKSVFGGFSREIRSALQEF